MLPRPFRLAARLIVKPTPSTLSESFAVFRYLQSLGEVTKFAKVNRRVRSEDKNIRVRESHEKSFEDGTEVVYDVEFSSTLPKLENLQNAGSDKSLKFKLDANAHRPDPQDLDPYNVRGLLDRKPDLPARRFACKLTLSRPTIANNEVDTQGKNGSTGASAGSNTEQDHATNQYSGPFKVDTTSIFAKIFQQIDTPRHMIAGLLPKVDDDHKSPEYVDAQGNTPSARHKSVWNYARRTRARAVPREVHRPDFSLLKLYQDQLKRRQSGSARE